MSNYEANIKAAEERVAAMDRQDEKSGFTKPDECGHLPQVAMSALEAGLAVNNTECLYEALVYLKRYCASVAR